MSSSKEGLSAELKSITVEEQQLRVTANVPRSYQAVLAGAVDGSSWTATLTQGPLSCPVTFQRSSDLERKTLPIAPVAQTRPIWSWITVGEMIFRHYGVLGPKDTPGFSTQCNIVRALFKGSESFQCSTQCVLCESMRAGTVHDVAGMLTDFPRRLAASGRQTPRIFAAATPALEAREVMREIDQGNPIVVGLSSGAPDAPSEGLERFFPPMHAALVVGYLKTAKATWYLVFDPFPFSDPVTNPYMQQAAAPVFGLRQGASVPVGYWIRESALKSGMKWTESFLLRSEPVPPPPGSLIQ
ncbi:hypothetical protein [Hyalangium versicolor]|uniref:hypothetical protein n=1 Tax=Hyalangium versicolor TaxID=2861190 RepID=UPI001CCCBBC4|nr:hypothetical protein [Hyalangium versicolor]